MKIAILSQQGIEEVVNEELKSLPLNQRFEHGETRGKPDYIQFPYKVRAVPIFRSYVMKEEKGEIILDVIGPYEDVPNFMISSSDEERRNLKSFPNADSHTQAHLVILHKGVYFRTIDVSKHRPYIVPHTKEGIYFVDGTQIDMFRDKVSRTLWENAVEGMVDYYLRDITGQYISQLYNSQKVIFDCERSRDKVVEVLEKKGLQLVRK